ncbi:MAG: diguanylate cyclase [Drouetiella hepatica Uher 2000/2452]|jgi:diguanylate cyclase (GGDEF)-like protein|uniref:Diguanylate cyclase n=1 Tax=Drouetiella hepatica Uher 2000/2452 TaxID=904376 RepID=A0A951QE59_9CYAN|nr:diguanylate cyclase [Drouetiella hepatica Uher 2000/2452]
MALLSPVEISVTIATATVNLALLIKWQQAETRIQQLTVCPSYGCLTRQGVDIEWKRRHDRPPKPSIVFFDIDGMKEANAKWGYAEVDRRISSVVSQIRSSELVTLGRYFSGDEFVIICSKSEAYVTANRICKAFADQSMSATFAIAPCVSASLEECVRPAADAVQLAKLQGRRGTIN